MISSEHVCWKLIDNATPCPDLLSTSYSRNKLYQIIISESYGYA